MVDLAHHIEARICVDRLLEHIFPTAPSAEDRPGRHTVLAELVENDPRLHLALLGNEPAAVREAWATCLDEHAADLPLLHTLAVLHRERALAHPAEDAVLLVATALWALLLSSTEFWATTSARVAEQQTELITAVAGELFGLHAGTGRRALAEGRDSAAEPHLRCLVAARSGTLADLLAESGIRYLPTVDEQLARQVSGLASGLLDDWSSDVIRGAEKALEDPTAIAELPSGISKNWAGGIDALRPLVRIGAPLPQVLRVGLDWYVDWCYALVPNKDFDGIEELLKPAGQFADALIPLAEQSQGHRPENQALSRYFMFRGYVATKVEASSDQYREALAWDPNNDEAQHLLDKSLAEVHNVRGVEVIDRMNEAIDKFSGALTEVLSMVKVWIKLGRTPPAAKPSAACPVCTKPQVANPGTVVTTIMSEVRRSGQFESTSSVKFWQRFTGELCADCASSLEFCEQASYIAARHFREALRIDPNHRSAQANLEKVNEMGAP